ncbi:ABC transporter permease [Micromonospora sp. 4G57]|uniref:Transport permease protein n=1 Tax=Micromonospora sicca TaxID=2202420 RepID=A0ABU5JAF3_9ACTN|nr:MULTISPECIES: ABC transporter permease [unclassified Micromonospora]MDZ5443926.1 ABC transporter permease [Micromonospora sp. 4G57]MDZ5489556.1 ABC transporter permease [Micromonospora sp. 4G53]
MTVAAPSAPSVTRADRRPPALGGFSIAVLAIEIRRVLRNRRTLVFILVMPAVFFLLFGLPQRGQELPNGRPVTGWIMISLAVYGAMVATTSAGAAVATERALGWSRQLRLTPLRPPAYVATKVATAMVLGLIAVLVEFAVGAAAGVRLPVQVWLLSGLTAWLGSLVFAAFGLFVGYLAPAENVMQFMGPILAILAMLGGLFVPLDVLPHVLQQIAKFTPVYGVGQLARAPLTGAGLDWVALGNVAGWTVLFGLGAARLFRRDTTRV